MLTPVIALITYGYTFRMGFFNYYLAIGLSFFALAIFWRGRGWERLLAVAIAPLVLLAHAIGFSGSSARQSTSRSPKCFRGGGNSCCSCRWRR